MPKTKGQQLFNRPVEPISLPPSAAETAPTRSWWLGAKTHKELSDLQKREQDRIAVSRFGRITGAGQYD